MLNAYIIIIGLLYQFLALYSPFLWLNWFFLIKAHRQKAGEGQKGWWGKDHRDLLCFNKYYFIFHFLWLTAIILYYYFSFYQNFLHSNILQIWIIDFSGQTTPNSVLCITEPIVHGCGILKFLVSHTVASIILVCHFQFLAAPVQHADISSWIMTSTLASGRGSLDVLTCWPTRETVPLFVFSTHGRHCKSTIIFPLVLDAGSNAFSHMAFQVKPLLIICSWYS